MASPSLARWKTRWLLAAVLLAATPARANAEAGPFFAYWQAPSGPGAEDGWTVGLLFPAESEEPRFLLAASVAWNRFHPRDFPTGPVLGFLFDAAGGSDDPLYYVEGNWWINSRFPDPVGGGELLVYDLGGQPVGRMSFFFQEFAWIEGEWEIRR